MVFRTSFREPWVRTIMIIALLILGMYSCSIKAQGNRLNHFASAPVKHSKKCMMIYSGMEKTVSGNQFGGSLLFETRRMWAVGGFYQMNLGHKGREKGFGSDPFYGILFQALLAKSDRLSLFAMVRTGFVNDDFFVVAPSVETRVHISSRVGFSIGAGFRHAYPSLSAKIFLKLF